MQIFVGELRDEQQRALAGLGEEVRDLLLRGGSRAGG
jgi:hypothetical protein